VSKIGQAPLAHGISYVQLVRLGVCGLGSQCLKLSLENDPGTM
jgi:hypothetical protein